MPAKPMSPSERRKRAREEMIDAILEEARNIMREEGAAALNLAEVARRIGIKPPSLYEYFDNKMAVYDALFALAIQTFGERNQVVYQEGLSFWERLQLSIEVYLSFAQETPELYQLAFERPVPGFEPTEETMAISWALLEEGRRDFAARLRASNAEPDIPPEQAFDLFIAMAHGLSALHMANEPHLPMGEGRFGSLVAAAVELFRAAWEVNQGESE